MRGKSISMKRTTAGIGRAAAVVACVIALVACASGVPPSRLGEYVGKQQIADGKAPELPQRPFRAGLVVISDTTAPDAAPALPDEAVRQLAELLQQRLNNSGLVAIDKIIPAEGVQPGGGPTQFHDLGKKHGLDYLAVAVLSGTEQEYPMTLFLGWVAHSQPGLRRDNWSLIEIAVIDVATGQTLLHAEGRGWATLDRPMAPGINQWYPVVFLQPGYGALARHWWPLTYEGAPMTLRVVSMNEAAKRVVLNLQDVWLQKRQAEMATAPG